MLVLPTLFMQAVGSSLVALAAEFPRVDVEEGGAEQRRVYDLIVLVVDQSLERDGDLWGMVNRYADDLVENYAQTDVQFLFYDSERDAAWEVSKALSDFYFNGAGEHENVMQGVVVIGDVPLPVVNKNGNRFVSMLPYSDFVDPAYVFDGQDFVVNETRGELKPEVWHGIIAGANEDLKSFFEKNHAYYEGDPEYRDFDRKVFFGDFINEESQIGDDAFKRYKEYTESAEDLVYNRFTKKWAQELSGAAVADLPLDNENIVAGEWLENLQNGDVFSGSPDVQAKTVIEQFLVPYFAIFQKYHASLNDWADYTGRYTTSDIDSVPELITVKDEYAKLYLRNVNDALERKVDEVVEKISKPLPLLRSVRLSGAFSGDEAFVVNQAVEQDLNFHYFNEVDGKLYVNGVASSDLVTAKLCSVFLGSSNLTRSLRSDDLNTGMILPVAGMTTRGTAEGFVVEGNAEYGMPAFYHNPLAGRGARYRGPFERTFREDDLIKSINGKVLSGAYTFDQAIEDNYFNVTKVISAINDDNFELLNSVEGNLAVFDGVERVVLDSNVEMFGSEVLRTGRVRSILGFLDIVYERDGAEEQARLSFTVTADGPILYPSTEDPTGSDARLPERKGIQVVVFPDSLNFPVAYNFDRGSQGAIFSLYDSLNGGYASRAYDASGGCNAYSTNRNSDRCLGRFAALPVLSPAGSVAAVDGQFPNRVALTDEENAVDLYELPEGTGVEEIDEYIMSACYGTPLPSRVAVDGRDSNPFAYVLDPTQAEAPLNGIGDDLNPVLEGDFYGRLLKSIGYYVGTQLGQELDYEERPGISDESDFSPEEDLWLGYDALNASEIVLHGEADERITLKDFSDRYGVLDGKDNDGDGAVDEADEANVIYGLDANNLPEIARKMLAEARRLVVPYGERTIELTVRPNVVREVPSLIRHNEPTNYTLSEQIKAGTTRDLPIDDPRYVAFQSFAGDVEKVRYVNLFDEAIVDFPALQAALVRKANELASIEGSYRVFGPEAEEGDFREAEIAEEILTRYLVPVVTSFADSPVSGFNLQRAEAQKVADNLAWQHAEIDEKHHLVLSGYLNEETEKGYEASYLALEGEEDNFTWAFDREVEEDQRFDPIGSRLAVDEEEVVEEEMEEDEDFEFVWLDQFLAELERFYDSFEYEPNFEQSCGYSEYLDQLLNGEAERVSKPAGEIRVGVAQTVVGRGGENVVVQAELFDEDGEVLRASDETFALEVEQDGNKVRVASGPQSASATGRLEFNLTSGDEAGVATMRVVSSGGVSSNALQLEVSGKTVSLSSESDAVVADGESVMNLQVQLLDENGQPILADGQEVRLRLENDLLGIVGESVVAVRNGVADFQLEAGTRAGAVEVIAEVVGDDSFPIGKKLVNVVAGPPTNLSVSSDSFVLVANNQSKTELKIELRDQFGNLANNDYSKVAVFYNSLLSVDAQSDIDPEFIGTQIGTLEGVASLEVQARDAVGTGTLIAVLLDYELEQEIVAADYDISEIDFENRVGARISLDVVDKLDLAVEVLDREFGPTANVAADGEAVIRLQPNLLYRGAVVENYNGPIEMKILTPQLASFEGQVPAKMVNGQLAAGNILLRAGTLAGELMVEVNVPGMARELVKVNLLAGEAVRVEALVEGEFLQARLIDRFGNLATGDNGRLVRFTPTAAGARLIGLSEDVMRSEDGVATTTIIAGGGFGLANVVVAAEGLGETTVSVPLEQVLTREEIRELAPKSLYISLLGGDFGNRTKEENAAQALLFSGKGQAVSALSSDANGAKKLLSVNGDGRVDILAETVESLVAVANSDFPYQRVNFSDAVLGKELASVFIVPKADLELKIGAAQGEGIFVEALAEDAVLVERDGAVHLENEGERVVTVDQFGRIFVGDDVYKVGFDLGRFVVMRGGVEVLAVTVNQDLDNAIRTLPKNAALNSFFPGVYVQILNDEGRFELVRGLSGNSTMDGLSVELVDLENELDVSQKPQINERFGYGFEGENKHMLLFAAGNSVGEANLADMSEATLVYGDPMVRLDNRTGLRSAISGFTKDLGKPILSSKKEIFEMVEMDFNGDAEEDVLLMYEDGSTRLLENTISNDKFTDRGEALEIFGAITAVTAVDLNNDGLDDLIVGTEESCHANDECISFYENVGSGFERRVLPLDLDGQRIYKMAAADLNDDGCSDLTISDSAGRIYSFYNLIVEGRCSGLEKVPAKRFNFGFAVSAEENLAENLFVRYEGMEELEGKMVQFALGNFVHLPADGNLSDAEKLMVDLNGEELMVGDEVEVRISLNGGSLGGFMVSDTTPTAFSLVEDSLECVSADCGEPVWVETGVVGRERVISGVSGNATVRYRVVVESLPVVDFMIGNNFRDYPSNDRDNYLDILVKTPGRATYLYSTGLDGVGRVVHDDFVPERDERENEPRAENVLEAEPDEAALIEEVNRLRREQTADLNYDGLPDSYGQGGGSDESLADYVGRKLENVISTFRCSGGGCFPTPYNRAFLVPDGPTPGIAAFAAGLPNPPFVATAYPSSASSTFRFYLSPTLSGGLGTAVCFGQAIGHTSPCFAYAIPPAITGVAAVCEEVIGTIADAIEDAKEVAQDVSDESGLTLLVSDGMGSNPAGMAESLQAGERDLGLEGLNLEGVLGDSDDPISLNAKVNVRIPGFPSVVTNWFDNQIDEIYNKLLDFPKFYLILPDLARFVRGNATAVGDVQFSGFNDFARSIAAIPLVEIESKEILVRVPIVSMQEVDKYKSQWKRWQENMKKQLNDRLAVWDCDENPSKRSVCDQIVVDVNKLVASVNELMDTVDRLANFPRDLLNYRNLEVKYAMQIVCYLDAITSYTGDYIKRQTLVIESWMRAIEDAIRTFKDWRVILDVMVEYQQTCDRCMNDRFSKLSLLLNFFAVIPDPPVIPLPKWPDIVVDLSKVKTGVRILWPDVTFKPEPISLPNLPDIILPELLPSVRVEIPGFEVPELPNLELPTLPDLPPLPLPSLPDLPLPPRIPPLPRFVAEFIGDLRPILRILCLLKTGMIPVPESGLATEIETLTQPSVQAALPILRQLGVQWPGIEYSYVKEVRIEAKTRFDVNTEYIYNQVKEGLDWWNKEVQETVDEINFYGEFDYGYVLNKKIQEKAAELSEEVFEGLEGTEVDEDFIEVDVERPGALLEEFERGLEEYMASLPEEVSEHRLVVEESYMSDADLNRSLADVEARILASDLPDDPLVNELAAMRDEALAYAQNLEAGRGLLERADGLEEFGRVLVQNDQKLRLFAAKDGAIVEGGKTMAFSLFGEGVESMIENSALNNDSRLLAAEVGVGAADVIDALGEVASDAQPKGVYVGLPNGMSENIMNYTAELGGRTKVVVSDFDDDGDSDVLISFGGDLYLKENYLEADERVEREGEVIDSNSDVDDHAGGGVVNDVRVEGVGNRRLEIGFSAVEGAVSYEVTLRKYLADRGRAGVQEFLFAVSDLSDAENPRVNLEVENGDYFVEVVAIFADGERGDRGQHVAANPSICMDEEPPFPSAGATEFKVPIFGALNLDAGDSFDGDGRVVGYYLETLPFDAEAGQMVTVLPREFFSDSNPAIDTDGDGVPFNDRSQSQFVIGPFRNEGDLGVHRFVLHVIDEAGNSSEQEIAVEVFAPEISLDPSFRETKIASGAVDPATAEVPFALMRERIIYRVVEGELVAVPRVEQVRNGETDASGRYEIKDFMENEIIEVQDADGLVIAEINGKTGNIGALAEGYEVVFESAQVPEVGSKLTIVNERGVAMGHVQIVADMNNDVVIGEVRAENQGAVNAFDPVSEDGYIWKRIPANDAVNPGGAMLVRQDMERVILILDASGNVVLLAPRVVVQLKDNNHLDQAVVLEVMFSGAVIGQILLRPDAEVIFSSAAQVPNASPRLVSPIGFYGGRYENSGGIEALQAAVDLFGEEELITRGDFTFALLELLCIVPRKPEAYSVNSGYNDVPYDGNNLARNYPYIKEATLLGLIEGYRGEEDAGGLVPFKPNATVNRAEALTMILRALEMKDVIDLSDAERGSEEAWYNGYVALAEDLGLIDGAEGLRPDEAMSYGELLEMVRQVLLLHSCEEADSDNDGMSDFCEEKFGVNDPAADEDGDTISNGDECGAGMNPIVPEDEDSDGDGRLDKMELLVYLTDPEEAEEVEVFEDNGGESGVFVVPAECNTCPCISTLVPKADIIEGDTFFPLIFREYLEPEQRIHIFNKGNEVSF